MAKSKPTPIFAAGVVVLRGRGKHREVLVVHRETRADWSLPKGKTEVNEYLSATAVRETLEETGVSVVLGQRVASVSYVSQGLPKHVTYWLGVPTDAAVRTGLVVRDSAWEPNEEISEVRWLRVHVALTQLTFDSDKEILKKALELGARTTPFVLLRHAHAEKRAAFAERFEGKPPSDNERPLSNQGESLTQSVAQALAAFGVTRVVSSPARRCFDTVAPHLIAPHQVVQESSISELDFDVRVVEAKIQSLTSNAQATVVCSHRPVLPTLTRITADALNIAPPSGALKPAEFVVFHRSVQSFTKRRLVALSTETQSLRYLEQD